MERSVIRLLALSMIFATVTSLKFKYHLPDVAKSLHDQCVEKGHYTECWSLNRVAGYPHCGRTLCATSTSRGRSFKAIELHENAPDGLYCGRNKMCYEGSCVDYNARLPRQRLSDPASLDITCYHLIA